MSPSASRPILLIGATGQIGWELARAASLSDLVVAPSHGALDLTNPDQIRRQVRALEPKLIVNAAAYTAVDRAEQEPELAAAINADAPALLAEEAKRLGIGLVHFSTDYVFNGEPLDASGEIRPYRESDIPNPINVYGRTKLAGERAIQEIAPVHLILRTSWIYASRGKNFLRTIQGLAREREELKVVGDQIGSPTWAGWVAGATACILSRCWRPEDVGRMAEVSGVYHLAAAGQTSWHGFATAIVNHLRESEDAEVAVRRVTAIATSEYPAPARRPAYSVLDCSAVRAALGVSLPDWAEQLRLCLEDYTKGR